MIKFPFTLSNLTGSTLKEAPALMVCGTLRKHSPLPLMTMVLTAGSGLGGRVPLLQLAGVL